MNCGFFFAGTVLLVDFSTRERQRLCGELAPCGYAFVACSIEEAFDASNGHRVRAGLVDASGDLEAGLRRVAEVRRRAPGLPVVLFAAVDEPFAYRRAQRLGKVVVLYAPASAAAVLDALDALTEGRADTTERPRDRFRCSPPASPRSVLAAHLPRSTGAAESPHPSVRRRARRKNGRAAASARS